MNTTNTDWNTTAYGQVSFEDRCALRHRVHIPAILRPSGERGFNTVVVDLALAGFCANSIQRMHPGNRCWLILPGLESLLAEVVWWQSGRVGCAFEQLLSPIVHDNILVRFRGDGVFRCV
ncbi:pilus assembly protein PilZ [Novosphingobium sp. AAP83]|uniref:pilus assembly protein PilZ n=1 Tax=Novosphingobium sp. AAP83 TaxID=1523425 RepID=UPI0006B9E3AD|nr:pilus assembly protein PilZ [Novosphingobium sp. AAP83]KPF90955.1 pilus assembly protein PilZ [Novosphingobium sp. AAP83]